MRWWYVWIPTGFCSLANGLAVAALQDTMLVEAKALRGRESVKARRWR